MSARLTEAEARRAGLLAPKSRKTRKAAPRNGAPSRCKCGEEFTTDAAETRHVEQNPGHCRIETVLT